MTSYRIVRVAPASYLEPIEALYRADPALAEQSHRRQCEVFFGGHLGYSDSFARGMARLGHEAFELPFNVVPLQRAWARERGVRFRAADWKAEILLAQLKALAPDVVYFQGVVPLDAGTRRSLKRICPSIRLVVFYNGFPEVPEEAADADLCLAGVPMILRLFRARGLRTELLYHAFDDRVLEQPGLGRGGPGHDFTFVGTTGYGYRGIFARRYRFLLELMRRAGLECWARDHMVEVETLQNALPAAWTLLAQCPGEVLERLRRERLLPMGELNVGLYHLAVRALAEQGRRVEPLDPPLAPGPVPLCPDDPEPEVPLARMFPDRCREPLFGLAMFDLLRRSRLTFNIHTGTADGECGNIRMFEATGVGTCLLTDAGSNLGDLFEAGREVAVYRDLEECVETARWLLEHEEERRAMARAGQRRTLREHTVARRCAEVDAMVRRLL
jgi:hypothetical protein